MISRRVRFKETQLRSCLLQSYVQIEDSEKMLPLIAALLFIGVVSCQLTPIENEVLLNSWKPYHIGNPTENSLNFILAWFTAYPQIQSEFQNFKDIPLSLLKNLPSFRIHSAKSFHAIDDAITITNINGERNWSNVENLSDYHKKLGKTNKTEYDQFRSVFMKGLKINAVDTVVWNKYLDIFFHHLFIHF